MNVHEPAFSLILRFFSRRHAAARFILATPHFHAPHDISLTPARC
jgi:hypothetical protein